MELTTEHTALYMERRPHYAYKLGMDVFPHRDDINPVCATLEPNESLSDLVDRLIVIANNADKPYGEWSETDKAICKDIPTYD